MTSATAPSPPPPLVVTRDPALLDELLRLAAAAGITPEVAADSGAALRAWSSAPVVLVGADVADELARIGPVRRPRVHVVALLAVPDELFRTALAVGAESVAQLPRSEAWLTEMLTDLGEADRAAGVVVGVLGGSGGAGATTFACALGQLASQRGRALVVDADPLGPGVDRVLGLEDRDGVRWDGLCQTTGRLGARALREALPRRADLGALTWRVGAPGSLQAFAVREVLSAARRGHDFVVVDLPRSADPVAAELADRCDQLLVVVVPTVAGVAAAVRTCARRPDPAAVRLVLRGSGIDAAAIQRATGIPVIVEMPEQRGLAEAIDLGLGPVRSRRSALGRAAGQVLDRMALVHGRELAA
ncbi:septum site-determining protein Ssd [Nocardioides mangrovi]|uniref:CpaE-like family protein n=1 Tax=Nocardioides mangrovi TaxID=2874580 RepID=A0ABS7UE56_9ACTN|nr:septum site-determining protein Ssd [Nocardioides mangrovi]MBZ5739100.1 CpaE-like family protein [Nocardioides mangrovi]